MANEYDHCFDAKYEGLMKQEPDGGVVPAAGESGSKGTTPQIAEGGAGVDVQEDMTITHRADGYDLPLTSTHKVAVGVSPDEREDRKQRPPKGIGGL